MSKFFNRNWKAGFTLVELIVVIAILAILAGIAIPVYSGYIKKANQAADEQLLGAVNTAFAAACLENGQSNRGRDDARLTLDGNGKVSSVSSDADVNNSFLNTFFKGNDDNKFKSLTTFIYNQTDGVFVGLAGVTITKSSDGTTTTITMTVNGKEITYTAKDEDIQKVLASTFGTNMTVGDLLDSVGGVVDAAGSVVNNPGLLELVLNGVMGADYAASLGIDSNDPDYAQKLSNALVVAVSKSAVDMVDSTGMDTLLAQITNPTTIDQLSKMSSAQLQNMATATDGQGLARLAMMYGMMTAYANSDSGKNVTLEYEGQTMTLQEYYASASADFSNASGGTDGLKKLAEMTKTMANTSGFQTYINTEAQTDFQGLYSSLSVINTNGQTMLTDGGVVDSGFSENAEILALLSQFFAG